MLYAIGVGSLKENQKQSFGELLFGLGFII